MSVRSAIWVSVVKLCIQRR